MKEVAATKKRRAPEAESASEDEGWEPRESSERVTPAKTRISPRRGSRRSTGGVGDIVVRPRLLMLQEVGLNDWLCS
jgi:hypothetical protein